MTLLRKVIPMFLGALVSINFMQVSDAAEIDTTHISCFQIESLVLATVTLECHINADNIQSDPQFGLQLSYNSKDWKNVKDAGRVFFTTNSDCSNTYEIKVPPQPLESPKVPQCEGFRVDYAPEKTGMIYLRLNVLLDSTRYISNAVPYDITNEIIGEQTQAKEIDARNKNFPLVANWPYKIPVGVPYKLSVSSKDKYSGICNMRATIGSPITGQTFNIKNGLGKTQIRGLRTGNSHIVIACTLPSGSGPTASTIADVYFSN